MKLVVLLRAPLLVLEVVITRVVVVYLFKFKLLKFLLVAVPLGRKQPPLHLSGLHEYQLLQSRTHLHSPVGTDHAKYLSVVRPQRLRSSSWALEVEVLSLGTLVVASHCFCGNVMSIDVCLCCNFP